MNKESIKCVSPKLADSENNVILLHECTYAGIKVLSREDAISDLFKIPNEEVCELCKYYYKGDNVTIHYNCMSNYLNSRGIK